MSSPAKRLRDLPGLGPKSEKELADIGISTPSDLIEVGPIQAFLKLAAASGNRPSLNFLYALVGAVEARSWLDVAREERFQLLMQLEDAAELQAWLDQNDANKLDDC